MENTTITAALVAVIMVLYKVVEFLIQKFSNGRKNGNGQSVNGSKEEAARQARETYEHVVFQIGPELKIMSENQKEIVKNLASQAQVSEKSIELLNRLGNVVSDIEQRMKVEEEVQKRLKVHSGKE